MACKKYILTNNTASAQTFSYQECSNNMWIYDVLLEPGQTKTIWFVSSTFQSYYTDSITITDEGAFPPTPSPSAMSPSPTPTPSVTATVTPTKTVTPTVTPSISVSPSVTPTITSSVTPTPTITPTNTLTPTPSITATSTQTPTPTPSITATSTQTPTPTPSTTPSFNFVVSNTNTGGTYVEGITGTTGSVTTKSGYSYPVNSGETLYADFTTSGGTLVFDVQVKDPSSADFLLRVNINGSTSQTFTPGPGDIILNAGPYTINVSDVVQVILENN